MSLQVLKARAVPRVENAGRDSFCPSKFRKCESKDAQREGFAQEESTLSAGEAGLGCREPQGQDGAQSSAQEGCDHWAWLRAEQILLSQQIPKVHLVQFLGRLGLWANVLV